MTIDTRNSPNSRTLDKYSTEYELTSKKFTEHSETKKNTVCQHTMVIRLILTTKQSQFVRYNLRNCIHILYHITKPHKMLQLPQLLWFSDYLNLGLVTSTLCSLLRLLWRVCQLFQTPAFLSRPHTALYWRRQYGVRLEHLAHAHSRKLTAHAQNRKLTAHAQTFKQKEYI